MFQQATSSICSGCNSDFNYLLYSRQHCCSYVIQLNSLGSALVTADLEEDKHYTFSRDVTKMEQMVENMYLVVRTALLATTRNYSSYTMGCLLNATIIFATSLLIANAGLARETSMHLHTLHICNLPNLPYLCGFMIGTSGQQCGCGDLSTNVLLKLEGAGMQRLPLLMSLLSSCHLKILFVSPYLPYGITIHDSYVIAESKILYWDITNKYFNKEHLPYAVAAILILIIFILSPALLLFCYPTNTLQEVIQLLQTQKMASTAHFYQKVPGMLQGWIPKTSDLWQDCT